MPVAMPFRFLDVFFRHHGAARTMEAGAIDQTSLKSLQLLAGNDMIVNVNDHEVILPCKLIPYYQTPATRGKTEEDWRNGVLEYWIRIDRPMLDYSNTPSIVFLFGGRNIKLNTAEVASAPPKIANESP